MKPKQIVIYGLLSFLIASSLAMYVYLGHRLPQYNKTNAINSIQKVQIENLSDPLLRKNLSSLQQHIRYELK